ncbi:MAG: V-type ATP synthase subunit F [Gammaproteobacteria bacterium]|nr:V-type ATP synthase subunit F [Gammaproteobacteria bacterium]MDH3449176.1 V-type ATP synthase subunit F [Gammaproteobacteria bacterium]
MEIIAIGTAALMDGFALLGIRTYADASTDEINSVLTELARSRERALVYLQQDLMTADIPMIQQLRNQGGSILICEIPNLHAAGEYRPAVEKLIGRVLGNSILELRLD